MNHEDTLKFIRECISKVQEKFQKYPTLYLNESDIQSDLFSMLSIKLGEPIRINKIFMWGTSEKKPNKPIFSMRIHSELLLPEGRIDLAILDLKNTKSAMNSRGRYGYISIEQGNHIFIEIKSSRTNRSKITSRNKWKELILKDIDKLNKYSYPCFLLCFDFRDLLKSDDILFLNKKAKENVELVYCVSAIKEQYLLYNPNS